ncbi:MAG: hypothetical protein GYA63_06505 [Armatimonadetes bacterium]|jgi:hypothetical protein|nr:hypothetical protein [Armatimonadota bacterium]HOC31759.1 hypothetical protein [Armatimonadota bacterium]
MNSSKLFGKNGIAALVATGVLIFTVGGSALAGSFAIRVSNVQVSLGTLYPGQTTTVSYAVGGASTNIPGGLVNVKIEFLSGATVVKTFTFAAGQPGAQPGANVVVINAADLPSGGPYTVRVTATGGTITAPDWLKVSSPTDPNMQFLNPRGVDVNRITGSPYLGRIYVTEGGGGATANRTTVDGLYILNPDLTPAFPTPKATSADIGVNGPWGGTANSPFRPYVMPDGNLLIPDSSDGHCGLFWTDGNGDDFKAFFAYPYPPGGSRTNDAVFDNLGNIIYGSTAAVWVEGTGANRVMYAVSEDVPPFNTLMKYAIGAGTQDLAIVPELVGYYSAGNWYMDFVRDSAGNFYVVSDSMDNADKLSSDGTIIASLPSTGATYLGICIDDARNEILIAATNGTVYKTTKAFNTVTPLFTGLGNNVRDVAIDNEHWIYAIDSSDSFLHVWAPAGTYPVPDGVASAAQTVTVIGNPTPGDVWPVGPGGLFTGPNGTKYGDGSVTIQDAAYALRIAAGLNTVP